MKEQKSHLLRKTAYSIISKNIILIFLVNVILLSGCISNENSKDKDPSIIHGMDTTILQQMTDYIEANYTDIESVIISRNDSIILEQYFSGFDSSDKHNIYSCTKSVTSALIGIAIDEGYLNLGQKVLDFFPNKTFANVDSRKQNIAVEHLLEMRSGLEWDEWSTDYMNSENPIHDMLDSPDWVQFVLDQPMSEEPGTSFTYNTGVSHILSAIIQQVTNVSTLFFAQEKLFEPLGIQVTEDDWLSSPKGVVWGGAYLHLTPREMLSFGKLYLNNGTWNGEQIISEEWIERSTRNYFHLSSRTAYSYQWWIYPEYFNYFTYTAEGYLGQWITIIPDLDIVIVFTANSYNSFHSYLLKNYILSSIIE